MKNWKLLSVIFASLLLVLAACSSGNSAESDTSNAEKTPTEETTGTETANDGEGPSYPLTVSPTVSELAGEDGAAATIFDDVTLEKMPEKIVVFDYGFLDTLDALGVEGIVGVPQDSTLPEHLSKYANEEYSNVGGLKSPLLEDIAELQPDVIFISGRQSTFYEQLKEITPNVVYIGTDQNDYWNTFLASVDVAAQIFGKEAEAKEHVAEIESAIEDVKALSSQYDHSLVTMYNEGKLSGFAKNSRYGYIYDIYGFTPVTEDIESSSHGSDFGFEAILEFNPQVLFVIDRTAAVGGESNISTDMENDIIKETDAYKNNKIVYLDGPLWYVGGGGLQSELAKIQEIINELK
nr:siderophore ABC transporter substrate-binding protein [Lysinibacillus timonensis]